MKKTAYGVLIAVIAFGIQGCAGKSKKASVSAESIPSALFSDVNPLHIAQYYLDNLYRPEKSQELYDLLAHETRENISFDRFTDYVHTLRVSIPADAYYTVMPYDAYVFEDKVLCYYIVVYEKNSVGGYALTELSLIRTQGIWQIAIDPGTEKFSPMPVLESGDITEFTRRDVASFKETINQRITAFLKAKQLPEEKDELLIEEPIKDKISKKIKKEMVVGQAYFEVGNFEKAKESFEKVLSYDPEDQTARKKKKKSI
ncbi:tetratricopeptide repeat protein, partial [bacterium]|nr:tetratricopeptide repeat protein [bacterium]